MKAVLLFCASILITGSALAVPVTWKASGTIILASQSDALPLSPHVGDAYSYTITFDNETPDTNASPFAGEFPGAILSAVFSIGGASYGVPIGPGSLAYTFNDGVVDYYQLSFETHSVPFGVYPQLITQFGFFSRSPLAPNTDALLVSPPSDLSIYTVYFDILTFQNSDQARGLSPAPTAQGRVNSIVMVSEPASIALLAIGVFGLGFTRRRNRFPIVRSP